MTACQAPKALLENENLQKFPPVILWAWERPENLEFIDSNKYGVAFLAQTIILQKNEVIFRPRRQPLKVNPETKLIAVTRIESQIMSGERPDLTAAQQREIIELVLKTIKLPKVSAVQIDFDAAVSERDFYRNLLSEVRAKLPTGVPLSITALASFCIGDRWFEDLPIDEAVPMIFRMGADDQKIKGFLANGNDFNEPLCRKSYGIAVDEPVAIKFVRERRIYVFNNRAWTESDVKKVKSFGIE
ncbi:MAG: DUF3142 domain-containing protein [Pyrinomonadaceae bacterium]